MTHGWKNWTDSLGLKRCHARVVHAQQGVHDMRPHVVAKSFQDSGEGHPRERAAQFRTNKHCVDIGPVAELLANVIKEFAVSLEAFPMKAKLTGDLGGGLAGQN